MTDPPDRWPPSFSMTTGSLSLFLFRSVTNFNWYHLLDEPRKCVWILRKTNSSDWRRPIGYKSWNEHRSLQEGSLLSFQFTSFSLSFFFLFRFYTMCETWVPLLNRSISFLLLFFFLEGIYRFPINFSCEPVLIKINPFTCIYITS